MFPSADVAEGVNLVNPETRYQIPSGAGAFRFNDTPGVEKVFILASRERITNSWTNSSIRCVAAARRRPIKEEASRPCTSPQNIAPIADSLITGIRNAVRSRDRILEKVDNIAGASKEHAIYVANTGQTPGRVQTELNLKHQQ